MARYHGGHNVKGGFYLNHTTWEFESVPREGGILSGNKDTGYSRLPTPTVIVAGPLTGLAYIISLPILFCLSFCYLLARWVGWRLKTVR